MAQQIINTGAVANDGTGDPLRTAFTETNNNFTEIYTAGPVDSNVRITDNTILTLNTNGNLVLAPNGTGKVVANVDIVPNTANVRNLGGSARRWSTLYLQYADISNTVTIGGDLTVGGNLTVSGNIIPVGNIVTDALTIQLGNTAANASAANGAGITVGANDNIATMLYNSTGNVWNMNIGVSAVGNIAGNYFIGNGSLLTGLPEGYGNSNVATFLAAFGSNTISTSGNVTVGNILPAGYVSATGNVRGANFNTVGVVSATGNISGNYFIGNAAALIGLSSAGEHAANLGVSGWTELNSNVVVQVTGNANSYAQINFQNISDGTHATTDYIATAESGNDSTYFVDMGIASGNYDPTDANNSLGNSLYPQDSYLYAMGGNSLGGYGGNLVVGSNEPGGVVRVIANGSTVNDIVATFSNVGMAINGNISATGNITGNYFIGDGSQLTGVAATGNLEITGTLIEIAAGATETSIVISPSGPTGGQAFVDVPNNVTANTANLRIYNSLGNIELGTDSGNSLWSFDATGNLNLPTNGDLNFNGGSIAQTLNEDIYIRASDDESDGWSVYTVVDDGAGNTLSHTRLEFDQYTIRTDAQGAAYTWAFRDSGVLELPGDIYGNVGGNLTVKIGDQAGSDTFIDLQTRSYVGDALISNIRIANPNVTVSTAAGVYNWTFDSTGNLNLPPSGSIIGVTANNNGYLNWIGNSSGDGYGYTTMRLVPDDTISGDSYLIIDPTAPNHIHIRAGGAQDNSGAQLYLGGENSYFLVENGANSNVYVASNSNQWKFDSTGILTLPGEGVLQSLNDTVTLSSLNTTTGNANSVYLGSSGGLGFNDQAIGGNWLEIFRSGSDPEIRVPPGGGNILIAGASGSGGAGGRDITITAGPADQTNYYTTAGGTVNIVGGLGATDDGGGGGPGGNVNITAGASADPAGHAGNVNITAGSNSWAFDYAGGLALATVSSESAKFVGTRKVIGGLSATSPYSVTLSAGGTPTVAYTALSNTQSVKVTFAVASNGAGFQWEQFDVVAVPSQDVGSAVNFVVSNRVKAAAGIPDTAVTATMSGGQIQISLTLDATQTSGGTATFDAVEFGLMVD